MLKDITNKVNNTPTRSQSNPLPLLSSSFSSPVKKYSYPSIRKPYSPYTKRGADFNSILIEYEQLLSTTAIELKTFCTIYHPSINYQAIWRRWKNKQKNKEEDFNKENRGGHNKIWDDEKEQLFADYIKEDYSRKNKDFCNTDLTALAIQFYQQTYPILFRSIKEFKCSNYWIQRMKLKYNLYSGAPNVKHRVQDQDKSTEIAQKFLESVNSAISRYGPDLVLAMDETFWRMAQTGHSVIKIRGEHNNVEVNANPKAGLTTVVTVTASGKKLTLMFIKKGKTENTWKKTNNKLSLMDCEYKSQCYTFTKNGWMTETAMVKYAEEIVFKHTSRDRCALILDVYKAHKTEEIRCFFENKNVELIFVPARMTDTLSPLDVGINGPFKSIGRSMNRQWRLENPDFKLDFSTAVKSAIDSFKLITEATVRKSFRNVLRVTIEEKNSKNTTAQLELPLNNNNG